MNLLKRMRLFAKDYASEFGIAWSLARMRDCERNGGHRWGEPKREDVLGWCKECSRCGTAQSFSYDTRIPNTTSSGTHFTLSPTSESR